MHLATGTYSNDINCIIQGNNLREKRVISVSNHVSDFRLVVNTLPHPLKKFN